MVCFVDPNEEITEVATPVNPATELLKQGAGKQQLYLPQHLPTVYRVLLLLFIFFINSNKILKLESLFYTHWT